LNKSSRLPADLGVTIFMTVIAMNLVTLCCATKSDLRSKTNCDPNHTSDITNLVTPKVGAKHEFMFKRLASDVGLLNI
jgi:hypothetical protein